MTRPGVFEFKPFSQKQKKVLTWWCDGSAVKDKDGIIADGAIRSGKTLSTSLSFVIWAMERFQFQNMAMCGKTIGSFRRNVWLPLRIMLLSRGYTIQERRGEHLVVIGKRDTYNVFYFFGGRDESSQTLIQGITLAGILFDEVALMPQSFVEQGIARCSVEGSKLWFNCNPEGPGHWFYTDMIQKCNTKNLVYLHFTMDDNPSLSEQMKQRYRSLFSGVFYSRFIQGLWVIAEGVIYDMWDDKYIYDTLPVNYEYRRYIAVDYGTTNPMVFLDIYDDGEDIWIENEYYYSSKDSVTQTQKSDTQYGDDLDEFIGSDEDSAPRYVIIDPSAASFKVEARGRGYRVRDADNDVNDGIRRVATLITQGKIHVNRRCVNFLREIRMYQWDKKAAERGVEQPVKQNDHCMDPFRYLVNTALNRRRFIA